jgi:glycosyltransferase involved in cell wall biosynthesis
VLPNAAPPLPSLPGRDEARTRLGVAGPVLAFAGRITKQKSLGVALDALARVEDVSLLVAGDGPDLPDVRLRAAQLGLDGRVRFLGPVGRDEVLELFRAADASLLTSSWENFPHTVVEALAVGTPVIATRVGGVPELVRDGENGLLVPPGDVDAVASAVRRLVGEPGLRDRLAAAAARSVEELRPETVYTRLEEILRQAATR